MTAPLLSPTDITPKIDFDEWLHTPFPDASNTSTNAACADFAAAILNRENSFISLALPPSSASLLLPTRTLPQQGVSGFYSNFELRELGDASGQVHSTYTATASASDQNSDVFFSDFTEDMIWEQQACYNSWMDIFSDHQTDPQAPLNQAAYQYSHTNTEFLAGSDTAGMLDLSFLSQSGLQSSLDTSAIMLAVAEEESHAVIGIPPSMNEQPDYVSSSQWMAVSDYNPKAKHDYEQVWDTRLSIPSSTTPSAAVFNSSAFPQEHRQGKCKSASRGAVVKKKHITFINHTLKSTGTVATVDGPSPNRRQRRSLDDEEREETALLRRIGSIELSRRQYDCKTLHLTQGYGSELVIEVALFDPQPGDKTAHMWHGNPVELPPYCIIGIEQASQKMMEYVRKSRSIILLELLSSANDITREFLLQADRYQRRSQNILVQQALDLLTATRIIERDWDISGPETLGISAMLDPLQNNQPKVPVTPVMDGQLDQMATKSYLVPLREILLANLQKTIYAGRKEDWFSILLATFIYLTHIECLLQHSRRNAKRYGLKRRYNDINLAEKYFEASRIALAHFHCIANASTPLMLDWTQNDVAAAAKLDSEQIAFIGIVRTKMEERRTEGSVGRMRSRHMYEEPLYFCHQLFEEKWVAGVGRIVICEEVVV
ncbi:hypothetical protein EG328_009853 [Venturia inaequalis]|uniref:Uncharacterized protein n=1 Tax=Venturia inaequalis TaxID=5025 RepID=A0A8H3Z525_VENIN|nr:hypothetical protein EG328_009853 [Venturia inaequalis]